MSREGHLSIFLMETPISHYIFLYLESFSKYYS